MGAENPPAPPADPTDQTDWSRLRELLEQPGPPNVTNMTGLRGRLERSRIRRSKKLSLLSTDPDYGREIPPRLNPDVPAMVEWLKQGYRDIRAGIPEFHQQIATLNMDKKLGREEFEDLWVHYRALNDAVNQALFFTETWIGDSRVDDITPQVHFIADWAKFVYAVGTRDVAALAWKTAELAHIGKLDAQACENLQRSHCLPMWETIYHNTRCAVRDERTWDGMWDWSDNTYSDGRQVMMHMRVKGWEKLNRDYPFNALMCGDGAINEHPRASICQIAPVIDPNAADGYQFYEPFELDLEELLKRACPVSDDNEPHQPG